MKFIVSWIKNNPIRTMFLIPIILVAAISISHVVTWYSIANPINWAIYLSIAIEVGAMTALVAATNRVKGGVWFMFGLVTFIQMVGNIYFSFKEIDTTGELWHSWIELTTPIWEMVGTELTDTLALKRWLAFLEGGLLPIISLTSLHFFVKFDKRENEKADKEQIIKEYFEARNKKIEEIVEENEKKEDITPTEKEDDTDEWDESHALDMVLNGMVEDLDETEYLLKTEANKEHLEESIKQAESGEDIKKIKADEILNSFEEETKEKVETIEKSNSVESESEKSEESKAERVKAPTPELPTEETPKEDEDILKKAMDEYNTKKEVKTPPQNKPKTIIHGVTQTLTGKAKTKRIE